LFWENSLSKVGELIVDIERLDRGWQKIADDIKADKQRRTRELDDLYAKYPNAPPGGHSAAEKLRDQAADIESKESTDQIKSLDQQVIQDARRCKQVITEKLQTM
jgi:hypothetical protein